MLQLEKSLLSNEGSAVAAGIACAAAVFFAGCATTVNTDVVRPANLDVEKYNSVTALPFRTSTEMGTASYSMRPVFTFDDYYRELGKIYSRQNEEKDLLALADAKLIRKLAASEKFRYVDPKSVERAIELQTPVPVDVYITGGITSFSSKIEEEKDEIGWKDAKGNMHYENKYWCEASATFLYQVVESKTNRVLSYDEYSCSASSLKETDWRKVESAVSVLSPKLDGFISRIMEDFAPYTVRKSLTMLKSKDSDMKDAEQLVHDKQLVLARNQYLSIYKSRGLFEAGYNAALLYEAMEQYDSAMKLMKEVYLASGDSRAKAKIADIQYEMDSAERLRTQQKK